jgi:transposase InsO family protein
VQEIPEPTVPGWSGGDAVEPAEAPAEPPAPEPERRKKPGPKGKRKSPALQKPDGERKTYTGEEKLLILDVWEKSNLAAADFCTLIHMSPHTLYAWRKKLDDEGPQGLFPMARGPEPGSKVAAATRRAILMLKEANPEYGCQRISDILYRGPGMGVSPPSVARVLKEEGYESAPARSKPHPDKPRRFERAKPNQLWQSDMFTFVLKRQGQRVHLAAFMDDHSRFITAFGLASRANTAFVLEVVSSGIGAYGPPEEMLTDQGPQYYTWRGKSAFAKEMEKRGIRHILARPRHPQTLGKVERFWGTLWRECVETAVFIDLEDARRRIAFFIDHYNFQRPHQGIGSLVPADRFFSAESEVKKTLAARVSANALELAKNGTPRKPFYLTGRVGDVGLSVHTEGEKVVMTTEGGKREEVDLRATGKRPEIGAEDPPEPVSPAGPVPPPRDEVPLGPGESHLDGFLEDLQGLAGEEGE